MTGSSAYLQAYTHSHTRMYTKPVQVERVIDDSTIHMHMMELGVCMCVCAHMYLYAQNYSTYVHMYVARECPWALCNSVTL